METRSSRPNLVKPLQDARQVATSAVSRSSNTSERNRIAALDELESALEVVEAEASGEDAHTVGEAYAALSAARRLAATLKQTEERKAAHPHWYGEIGRVELKGRKPAQPARNVAISVDEVTPTVSRAELLALIAKQVKHEMASPSSAESSMAQVLNHHGKGIEEMPHPLDLTNPGVCLSPLMLLAYLRQYADPASLLTTLSTSALLSPLGRELSAGIVAAISPVDADSPNANERNGVDTYVTVVLRMYRLLKRENAKLTMGEFAQLYSSELTDLERLALRVTENYVERIKGRQAARDLRAATLFNIRRMPIEMAEAVKLVNKRPASSSGNASTRDEESSDGRRAGQRARRKRQREEARRYRELNEKPKK